MFDRIPKVAVHVALAFLGFLTAYQAIVWRSPTWWVNDPAAVQVLQLAVIYAGIALLVELFVRVERSPWRFVSVRDALILFRSTALTTAIFVVFMFLANRGQGLPRSTVVLAWGLYLGALAAVRLLRRSIYEGVLTTSLVPLLKRGRETKDSKTLVVVGEVEGADAFLREFERSSHPEFLPLGVVTRSKRDAGKHIRGVPVLGSVEDWEKLRESLGVARAPVEAVLFLDEPTDVLPPDALGRLTAENVTLLRRPRIMELSESESAGAQGLREITIEELLSRPSVDLNMSAVTSLVAGKRILVTGAGGSIGSEICRQAAALGCSHLTLLDHSEFALFLIDREIADSYPTLSRRAVLCNIRDGRKVRAHFDAERPDIVFHAAALKHVPLVEDHPAEGVLTNILGTCNVAEAAAACGAADMVQISTDKAVSPSNVMGATKRLAEAVVRSAGRNKTTRFSVVRFGNVLASAGSVVPIFKAQIDRGGPITVTHPDVERYFMTIPEAVQLVLQAAALSQARSRDIPSVFVLEMGKPVRIHDLARRMIELSGRREHEIRIDIIGLRPGEKLSEDLVDETETIMSTHAGVMEVSDGHAHPGLGRADISDLIAAAEGGDGERVKTIVFEMLHGVRLGHARVPAV